MPSLRASLSFAPADRGLPSDPAPRRGLLVAARALLGALALSAAGIGHTAALAEEGCPAGRLPQERGCVRQDPRSHLPLDVSKPMRFEAIQATMTTIWIQATGTITADTPAEFERFLRTSDAGATRQISFHSPGGNLMAGLQLGQAVRRAGYNTTIGHSVPLDGSMQVWSGRRAHCLSACAYAFLGGVTRDFGEGDTYGIHRFGTRTGKLGGDDAQVVSGLVAQYVQSMGVDVSVFSVASTAAFEDGMHRLDPATAKRMRVIFDPTGLTSFVVQRRGNDVVASFDLELRGQAYKGWVSCSQGARLLVLADVGDAIPQALRRARRYPVEFHAPQGRSIHGEATYLARTGSAPGLLAFVLPGLDEAAFLGEGLSLFKIEDPHWKGGFAERAMWLDANNALPLSIKAPNADRTLPIVLDDCGAR